ncbi:MAG: insulinase family protein [Clostridiales bacterium]|nr:insulinase family protein [Clostridiales bacterium]
MGLHFIKTDKFKTSIINILIRRQLSRGEVTKNALIVNILRNGSAKYPSIREVNNATEQMFGSIFDIQVVKKSEEQMFQFYFEFLAHDCGLLQKASEFLNEVIYRPLVENNMFKEQDFRLEKDILNQMIIGRVNNKSTYARERCIEIMCKGEPFGLYADGYTEDLDKITNKALFEHYENVLKTSPIEVIVLGAHEKEDLSRYYGSGQGQVNEIELPVNYFKKSEVKRQTDYLNVLQNKICIGLRVNGKAEGADFFKMLIFNEILGGGSSSLLFRKVREEENLCYYIHSILYRFKSIIIIESGIDNTEKAEDIIVKLIWAIAGGDFTEPDVAEAKKSIIKKFNALKDKQAGSLDFYISNYLAGDSRTIDESISEIEKINRGDVLNIAEDIYIDTVYYLMGGEAYA